MSEQGHDEIRFEERDVRFRPIVWASIGLGLGTLFFCALMWGLFQFLSHRLAVSSPQPNPLAAARARTEPPAPRLLVNPVQTYHDFRTAEDAELGGYGWVDERAGIVRVPIERAMKSLSERGLPHRDSTAGGGSR